EWYMFGPRVLPGRYQVRLTVGDRSWTQPFEVVRDPRVTASDEDLKAQFDLLLRIRDKVSQVHDAVNQIRNVRRQVEEWERRIKEYQAALDGADRVSEAAKSLKEKLAAIEGELIQVKGDSPLQFPSKLNEKLATMTDFVDSADSRPTRAEEEVFASLSDRADEQLERLRDLIETDLAQFNALIREVNVPAIVPSKTPVPARP
ncbi:MAG: glycosyl hydrolase, partial [Thermomicrobiaceae bacterium]|nr:glycosyl hydrolase [Thermomicrobiaceae bacterium]